MRRYGPPRAKASFRGTRRDVPFVSTERMRAILTGSREISISAFLRNVDLTVEQRALIEDQPYARTYHKYQYKGERVYFYKDRDTGDEHFFR